MPHKTLEARRAYYRKRREDPEQLAKQRAYHREYTKRRRKEDPVHATKQLAYQRAWLAKHGSYYVKRGPRKKRTPEEEHAAFLERKRRFNKKHRARLNEESRIRSKKDRARDPERFKKREHARYLRHGFRRNCISRARRYKMGDVECYFNSDDWLALLRENDFRCFYCHETLTKKTRSIDHKTPLKRGGTNDKENLVPCCRRCNSRKHTQTSEEFMKELTNSSLNS